MSAETSVPAVVSITIVGLAANLNLSPDEIESLKVVWARHGIANQKKQQTKQTFKGRMDRLVTNDANRAVYNQERRFCDNILPCAEAIRP
jgi:hypothetical protein